MQGHCSATHALSRPTVDLQYTLIVADFRYRLIRGSLIFCDIFGRRSGGQLVHGTAYTRVYTVCLFVCVVSLLLCHQNIQSSAVLTDVWLFVSVCVCMCVYVSVCLCSKSSTMSSTCPVVRRAHWHVVCLSVYISVSVYVSVYVSVCVSVCVVSPLLCYQHVQLSTCSQTCGLFVCVCVCVSICVVSLVLCHQHVQSSIALTDVWSVCLCMYLSLCMWLCMCLSVCVSVCLSM